ncbi:hypothetical protein [Acinetobacter pittii]|uniref:hypothetical protein n=1 Tax=Acinetobacter pittii TaxID=48296 RepID=UPI00355AFA76
MDKLSQQELIRIRRGAEDAIQAMNRNHKSFIDAVSHPLNIIALVDMAQSSIGQQAKVEEMQNDVSIMLNSHKRMSVGLLQQQDKIEKLTKERDELQTLYTQQGINMLKLQKRVDAVKGLIEDLNKCYQQDHQNKFEYWRGFADSAGILGKRLEQALKGEGQ